MKLVNTLPVVLAAALVVAGCSEGPVNTEPTDPSFEISDGANEGNGGQAIQGSDSVNIVPAS